MSTRHEMWELKCGPEEDDFLSSSYRRRVETLNELTYTELRGHDDTLVHFLEPLSPTLERDAAEYIFALDALGIRERGATWEEARRRAADRIAKDVNRLTRMFVDDLTEDERAYRSTLLAYVDMLGGEIGTDFPPERWLLGHVERELFVPVQGDFEPIPIPAALQGDAGPGALVLARVAMYRDGTPKGEILEVEAAPKDSSDDEDA